jgi:hypothetical protein
MVHKNTRILIVLRPEIVLSKAIGHVASLNPAGPVKSSEPYFIIDEAIARGHAIRNVHGSTIAKNLGTLICRVRFGLTIEKKRDCVAMAAGNRTALIAPRRRLSGIAARNPNYRSDDQKEASHMCFTCSCSERSKLYAFKSVHRAWWASWQPSSFVGKRFAADGSV